MSENIKILYVEDEEKIRENTKRPLSYLSSELLLAKNGEEGLELYKEHSPDIVVSDIKMPVMTGIDMVKEIKKINKEQAVIFTTAHSESGFFIEAIELQVDGYILKPIDYDLLEQKIETVINQIIIKKRLKEQELINHEISRFQDNLLVIFNNENNIIFLNDKFMNFFNSDNIQHFINCYQSLNTLFLKDEEQETFTSSDKINWLNDLKEFDKSKRIVILEDAETLEKKSFLISIQYIEDTSHTIMTLTEVTSITLEKKEFEHKAFTDALTGTYNRAYFNEKIKEEIFKAQKDNSVLSLFIFDIDFFKKINDTYGHLVGDEILVELSKIVAEDTRSTDSLFRWGGEEFIKLLPNTTIENAAAVAEKLRKKIESHSFKNDLKITCSFGVTQFLDMDTEVSFIKKGDDALYEAKNNGRNVVKIYSK